MPLDGQERAPAPRMYVRLLLAVRQVLSSQVSSASNAKGPHRGPVGSVSFSALALVSTVFGLKLDVPCAK